MVTEFEEIYRTYFDDVYLYLRRLTGDEHIAEEITSETFFKAMRSISSFRGDVYEDPDGEFYYCNIEAWTSLWDKWISQGKGKLSGTVATEEAKPIVAVYIPNDGSENVCLAKYDSTAENRMDVNVEYESVVTLPRLALGYYLVLAAAALILLGIGWVLTRKKVKLRIWVERVALYPAAYIVSHCIVSGINWNSYSLPRDFALIVFLSILLYSGLLLAHNIWYLRREIRELRP